MQGTLKTAGMTVVLALGAAGAGVQNARDPIPLEQRRVRHR